MLQFLSAYLVKVCTLEYQIHVLCQLSIQGWWFFLFYINENHTQVGIFEFYLGEKNVQVGQKIEKQFSVHVPVFGSWE